MDGDDVEGALEVGTELGASDGPKEVICEGVKDGADETGFFVGGEVGADEAGCAVGVEVGAGEAGFSVFLEVGGGVTGIGVGAAVGFLVGEEVTAGCGELVGLSPESASLMAWLVSSHMFVRTIFCSSVGLATPSMSIDPLLAKVSKLSCSTEGNSSYDIP